jgi:hypothetical protein
MFARAFTLTTAAAMGTLLAFGTTTASAVDCPTVGETFPAGIYVASTSGELWRVDTRKGTGVAEATLIGDLVSESLNFYPTDIAFNDDGSLYGVDGFDLFCIDPMNGFTLPIGGEGFDPPWQTGLAGKTNSAGQLFGGGEDHLVHIQVGSGKGTLAPVDYGPLACGTETGDLVFDPDSDTLLGTVDCMGGGLGDRSHLVTVDPIDGRILVNHGPITDTRGQARYGVFGLAYGPDGALYAGSETTLMKLDPFTGRSIEDFRILSATAGKTFDRVDGMASRVCEVPPFQPAQRRTAGQWRQDCRDDSFDEAVAKDVDTLLTWVTGGLVTTTCDGLHHTRIAATVGGATLRNPVSGQLDVASTGLRRDDRRGITAKVGGRNDSGGGPDRGGMSNLCALGVRELTAAALNVYSGRVNSACLHCDDGPNGRYLDELSIMLRDAITADDDQTCNLVKREAHHITSDVCEGE